MAAGFLARSVQDRFEGPMYIPPTPQNVGWLVLVRETAGFQRGFDSYRLVCRGRFEHLRRGSGEKQAKKHMRAIVPKDQAYFDSKNDIA